MDYHVVPQFYSNSIETASNPVRTQALGSDGSYTLNITADTNCQVNVSTGLVATCLGTALLRRQHDAAQRLVRRQAPCVSVIRARQEAVQGRIRRRGARRRLGKRAALWRGRAWRMAMALAGRGRPWRGQSRSLLGLGGAAVDERTSRQRTRGWSSSGTAVGARWRARCAEAGGARSMPVIYIFIIIMDDILYCVTDT